MPEMSSPAPEIVSVVIHNDPIWIPPTYTTDPYTGVVTESPGRWQQNGTIEVTIKNRQFTPYTDETGNYINVNYAFLWKAHFLEWDRYGVGFGGKVVNQSNSDFTVVHFLYGPHWSSAYPVDTLGSFTPGSLLDFRVHATIGYHYRLAEYSTDWIFVGETSQYVEQTVTIPAFDEPRITTPFAPSTPNTSSSSKPSTSNINNPPQPQYNLIIIVVSVGIITFLLVVIAYLYSRQRKHRSECC